ncbi:MAG: hypothetical protein ACJAUP_000991 [Cellvibrionaceae bacterium]
MSAGPLKIGYSGWSGWVACEITVEKNMFEKVGVAVELGWFDCLAGMIEIVVNEG